MILLRNALLLAAILLLSLARLEAQTTANKAALPAAPPASAPLPKLRLDTAQTVACKVHFSRWGQVPNGEPNQFQLDFVADYAVQAQRPNRMRVLDLTSNYESRYIKDKKGRISILMSESYVSDGKQQMEWDNVIKLYFIQPSATTIADLGKEMQQPHLLYPELLFMPDALNTLKFKADGTEVVNGKSTAVYRKFPPNQDETVIYVDLQTRLPVRISLFSLDRQGDRAEMVRTDYSDWKFDVKFPPKTFDTTPPPGYTNLADKMKKLQKPAGQ